MAISDAALPESNLAEPAAPRSVTRHSVESRPWALVLAPLASLKLTVTLFAMSIFLVFMGTLAQVDHDVWYVVNGAYFRVWIARIEWVAFQRLALIFYDGNWNLASGLAFPFLGGKTIGLALLVNLLAAHAVRFKVAADGRRLALGLATIAAGLLVTGMVIRSGMDGALESELSPAFLNGLWHVLRGSVALLALAGAHLLVLSFGRIRRVEWSMLLAIDLLLVLLAGWLLMNPDVRIDEPGLRIVWQLVKGTAAGLVLLVGCVMVFRKRAGVVLLHGGIGLLMVSELITGMTAEESQMSISRGATVRHSSDIRSTELAVIDSSHAGHDHVTVVPDSLLANNVRDSTPIAHEDLAVSIQVHRWLPNSVVREVTEADANPARAGAGQRLFADEVAGASGVEAGGAVDSPSAYVEFFEPETNESLGIYLLSTQLLPQRVEVSGRSYDVELRFKQIQHPFSLTLKEFSKDDYAGTNTPKNFSSLVRLVDSNRSVDREVLIWMNNPLRYDGLTFYQADWDRRTGQGTVLQVVTNPGWMMPYVACMLVGTGMLAHFGVLLVRFLRRRAEEGDRLAAVSSSTPTSRTPSVSAGPSQLARWFPLLVVAFFALYIGSKARLPESPTNQMQIHQFGKLPLAYQGRIKPYDTLARNTLQILSGRQELIAESSDGGQTRQPAIVWLLDAISGADGAGDHRVFRIENLELHDALELERRPGSYRYSWNEIHSKPNELIRQIDLIRDVPEKQRSLYQNKVLELATKRHLYTLLVMSFQSPPLSSDPEEFSASLEETQRYIAELQRNPSPHAAPPTDASINWTTLMEGELAVLRDRVMNQPANQGTIALSSMLGAYARGDAATFNKQLSDFRRALAGYERKIEENHRQLKSSGVANAEILSQRKIDFEVFYNHFSPFYYAQVLYVAAFMLGVLSWVGWTAQLRRGSMALLWFTLALHTFALVARVYISGRPPVTNLYSTAIFIGWGGVLMAMVFESIYRLGLGNIAASVIGFLTLLVAYNLSLDGDTFIVLQAVLDTQFWLATHVVTINLGYAATYMAGLWGALYVLLAHVFPILEHESRQKLIRTLYGTLCFAIFFSFIGTVLGGLWADDSWGRFWGWDPKENGALMIVLWNALVLHARWGGLVKARGLATLAIGGNIITTWSYFGVNELGVGLHAYGASERNTAMWLLIFAGSQLALMALGIIPERWLRPGNFGAARPDAARSDVT